MPVRHATADERRRAAAVMHALWPEASGSYELGEDVVLVWDAGSTEELRGFITLSIRPWAEGCDSQPVAYVEGWWVAVELRGTGVGRLLMAAAEEWARSRGFTELGSDAELDNPVSLRAHRALGFEPTVRVQYFRKRLEG